MVKNTQQKCLFAIGSCYWQKYGDENLSPIRNEAAGFGNKSVSNRAHLGADVKQIWLRSILDYQNDQSSPFG